MLQTCLMLDKYWPSPFRRLLWYKHVTKWTKNRPHRVTTCILVTAIVRPHFGGSSYTNTSQMKQKPSPSYNNMCSRNRYCSSPFWRLLWYEHVTKWTKNRPHRVTTCILVTLKPASPSISVILMDLKNSNVYRFTAPHGKIFPTYKSTRSHVS